MYKMQIINDITQEIIREKTYKKPDIIMSLLDSAVKGQECFLFDEQLKTYKGFYTTHTVINEGNDKVYKVFFKVRLSEVQAKVAVR